MRPIGGDLHRLSYRKRHPPERLHRLNVIADQKKKFSEIRKIIGETIENFQEKVDSLQLKKRHSLIDPDPLLERLDILFDSFEKGLSEVEEKQLDVSDPDPVLQRLDRLLESKIGPAPVSQEMVDSINEEGKARYARKMPPGFKDSIKRDDKEGSHYEYGGIVYERQYGDLVIWKQILLEAENRGISSLVFLTDDVKEDWWWIVKGKKIGPCPELRDEICRVAGVNQFHIYNTEQFLRMSSEHLKVEVSEESIQAAIDMLDLTEERSLQQIVENEVMNFVNLLDDEQVVGTMAETNAFGYGMDMCEVLSADYFDSKRKIKFKARIRLSGEQDQDKPYCGDTIEVIISGTMEHLDHGWDIKYYVIESCEIEERSGGLVRGPAAGRQHPRFLP